MHYQVLQPGDREKRFMAIGTNGWGVSLASPSKSLLPPWQSFSWLSWIFFSSSCTSWSWSCSAPPLSHDPALRGDFRNPHSQNLTYLHQRRKDGNKSYPSETKTVQILLWPGRRPSFHFNHFETNSSWVFDRLQLLLVDVDLLLLLHLELQEIK